MAADNNVRAEECFREALQLAPDFAEVYSNLGFLLVKRGLTEEAEICYLRAIELNPKCAQTHLNLGVMLANDKRFDEAETIYTQAIALRPDSPVGWSNLGVLYACMKREDAAEQHYRKAIALDENYAMARFNLSYLLLRQARFDEGWYCLEARDSYAALAAHFSCPRWQGESLTGKSMLIGCEAGYGDMIHFCRYADALKAHGATSVTIICHPTLKTLFATLKGVDTVISLDEKIPASGWDFWTPLLSIPYYCGTRLDNIPAEIPYLHAPSHLIAKWADILPKNGLRIGLVWKGNPLFENDTDRSLPSLNTLAPLATVSGVKFISLQKGAGANEATQLPNELQPTDIGPLLNDFADTAAVVMNLDLVICVDTAIAHLSGALGKPCWVLLPDYKADWRWLTGRTNSPWYPGTMRLFRQSSTGNWDAVVGEMVVALEELAQTALSSS